MVVKLKEEKILERWGMLLERADGKADDLLEKIADALHAAEAPGVRWDVTDVKLATFGERRQFLLVTNDRMRDHRIYVNARDYGRNLDIN